MENDSNEEKSRERLRTRQALGDMQGWTQSNDETRNHANIPQRLLHDIQSNYYIILTLHLHLM